LPSYYWRCIWKFGDFSDCSLNFIDENAAKIRISYVVKIGSIVQLDLGSFMEGDFSAHFRRARARVNTSSAAQDRAVPLSNS
jgi:hypothetical protein